MSRFSMTHDVFRPRLTLLAGALLLTPLGCDQTAEARARNALASGWTVRFDGIGDDSGAVRFSEPRVEPLGSE